MDDLFYEEIKDNITMEIEDVLNRILGTNISEDQKDALLNSILSFYQKHSKEIAESNYMEMYGITDDFLQSSFTNLCNQNSRINIILQSTPPISFFPTNIGYNPSPMCYTIPQNQYFLNNPQYQMQMSQQPQIFQPQNFVLYNQLMPISTLPNNTDQNKHKSKSTKHDKKSKKRHSKHEKKPKSSKKNSSTGTNEKSKNIKDTDILTFTDPKGIISYLTNKTGGNIHDNGTIEVTTNSVSPINTDSNHPKNLLNDNRSSGYLSEASSRNVWIIFDFKKYKVDMEIYRIRIRTIICQIRNWTVEISNDKSNWTTVDQHSDDDTLSSTNSVKTFNVSSHHFARYIRFNIKDISSGRWGNSNYAICIDSIEFFGKLKTID